MTQPFVDDCEAGVRIGKDQVRQLTPRIHLAGVGITMWPQRDGSRAKGRRHHRRQPSTDAAKANDERIGTSPERRAARA